MTPNQLAYMLLTNPGFAKLANIWKQTVGARPQPSFSTPGAGMENLEISQSAPLTHTGVGTRPWDSRMGESAHGATVTAPTKRQSMFANEPYTDSMMSEIDRAHREGFGPLGGNHSLWLMNQRQPGPVFSM